MESAEALFVMYYAGLGFLVLLAWAGIAQALNEPIDDDERTRWRRASASLAFIGLLHPALAFFGRDIAIQVDRDDEGQPDDGPSRHLRLANWCTLASLIIAGGLVLLQLRGSGDGDAAALALQQARERA